MIRTLWDLLDRRPKQKRPQAQPRARTTPSSDRANQPGPASQRYETMQREMLARYSIRVRKWRSGTSGVAWQVFYQDGTVARLLESPRPRGPVSAAVFLHEVGHHAIGFETYKPRCLEELHAWCFSLDQMDSWGITITESVRKRVHESLVYAVDKARRRGLRQLPYELVPFSARSVQPGCWVDPRERVARGPSCPS